MFRGREGRDHAHMGRILTVINTANYVAYKGLNWVVLFDPYSNHPCRTDVKIDAQRG